MIANKLAHPIRSAVHTFSKFRTGHEIPTNFAAKIKVSMTRGHYTIKTADSWSEISEVLALRYAVFHREFRKKKFPIGLDIDQFDRHCDHLVIYDNRVDRIVGTYRMISSDFCPGFYSEQEFAMGQLLDAPGMKLELGRACIHQSYRNGIVISLLWRGISDYLQALGAKYVFGCASIKTIEPARAAAVSLALENQGVVTHEFDIAPTAKYKIGQFNELRLTQSAADIEAAEELIPPLFKAYLKAGVRVVGEPALDREFACIDFLTILRVDELDARYEKKFLS